MYKPMVSNRYLDKITKEKENDYMAHRLVNVKANINIKCPESFYFYKTIFKKSQMRTNELKEFEIRRNNQILVEKITNIFTGNRKNEIKKKKPMFTFKDNIFSQTRKWELYRIAQENQHMLKRLNERESFYDTKKWKKDYNKSQTYKKNICIFPDISGKPSHITQDSGRFPMIPSQGYSSVSRSRTTAGSDLLSKIKTTKFKISSPQNKTEDFFYSTRSTQKGEDKFYDPNRESNGFPTKKMLYTKEGYIGDLAHCLITFFVENKKFLIEVDSNYKKKIYCLLFEEIDEIINLQQHYKKYDQIVNDLQYDPNGDKIVLSNEKTFQFICEKHDKEKNENSIISDNKEKLEKSVDNIKINKKEVIVGDDDIEIKRENNEHQNNESMKSNKEILQALDEIKSEKKEEQGMTEVAFKDDDENFKEEDPKVIVEDPKVIVEDPKIIEENSKIIGEPEIIENNIIQNLEQKSPEEIDHDPKIENENKIILEEEGENDDDNIIQG